MIARTALTAFILALAVLASPAVSTASAHGIIDLDGVSAVAGPTSVMTLEVQHGCLPAEPTVLVEAFVGAPWRAVRPQPVDGWTSSLERQVKGG